MSTQIAKKVVKETKDSQGKVVKKIILEYNTVDYDGVVGQGDEQKKLEIAKESDVKRIKIAELIDNKWDFKIIDNSLDIELWKFENDID